MATISENLQTILNIKNDIKNAIVAKGVDVADNDGFGTYASKIESIEGGGTPTWVLPTGFRINTASTNGTFPAVLDMSNLTTCESYFYTYDDLTDVSIIGVHTSTYRLFQNCSALTSISISTKSNITDMDSMFRGCSSLTTVPLFDTSNVTSMSYMFSGCSNLTSVPLFDTSTVSDMSNMFRACSNLIFVPLFDTSNVTTMQNMFYECSSLTTVPLFDTSNVTNMSVMFYNCSQLTSVPLFNTSRVTMMTSMFSGCSSLTTIPQLNTSNVTNMNTFIYNCTALTSIPELNAGSVTTINNIGGGCPNLTDVGGFTELGKSYGSSGTSTKDLRLYECPLLTRESCMNIINKVYDMNLNTVNTYTPKIRLHADVYAHLSADDIAIATAKGWIVQAG